MKNGSNLSSGAERGPSAASRLSKPSSQAEKSAKDKGSGVKITIGLSNSQSGAPQSASSGHDTPQIPDNLSTSITISDLCYLPDGRKLQNKRRRLEERSSDRSNPSKGPRNPPSHGPHRQETTEQVASGPQVEIINGKIVIKESSLMVPSLSSAHEDFEEIEEGIHPTAKYSSFTTPVHSSTWGMDETKRFYEALRQCGTDFSLMQAFFPRRTRKQLKKKFFREETHHPELIKATLNSQVPLDLAPFEVHLGTIMPEDYDRRFSDLPATEPPTDPSDPPSFYTPSPSLILLPPADESELVDV